MHSLLEIIKANIKYRQQTLELAKSNLNKTYRGSDLGFVWAFAKPTMYIFVFYFAITIGFKSSKDIPGLICPYFVWLTIGMIAFFYMRDMVLGGASCFRRYKPIVSKASYPIITIPTSVALSFLFVHVIMMGIGIIISLIFGCYPSIYWLQIPFYSILMVVFSIFWSIATGIFSVIYRDFYNLLQVLNQALFWLSAILFDVNSISSHTAKTVLMFNPITFIVEGYRNAFCRHIWFFQEPEKLGCYMIMMVLMIISSIVMYKKFIKHIPDIL